MVGVGVRVGVGVGVRVRVNEPASEERLVPAEAVVPAAFCAECKKPMPCPICEPRWGLDGQMLGLGLGLG